ncbi:hypothetical protein [Blastopirellula marina]|uniref:Uncharacterized protein n=1 Tax=Blastopirellula marina TaxID=124 RepID=A0A2S8F275_9BACT|nr:hypothetical protein [Blastopirellula marina]PQO26249.1 hypothetical protein C5Y98_30855 [Blastopirellula marina]PTL40649.1 hypothetical protein C5Y97_30870 [Blastopirellula marina]
MHIDKPKLPKGTCYVTRAGKLETALADAGITTEVTLYFTSCRYPLRASFIPPNPNVGYERISISIGTTPSTAAAAARAFVDEIAIPQFIAWATEILALPPDSPRRQVGQDFEADIDVYRDFLAAWSPKSDGPVR